MARPQRKRLKSEVDCLISEYRKKYNDQDSTSVKQYPNFILPSFPSGQDPDKIREWRKLRNQVERFFRQENNLCTHCGAQKERKSLTICDLCASKNSGKASGHHATLEERNILFQKQGGICPLCLKPLLEINALDHCHKTLKIRGILHTTCNFYLGGFEALIPDAKALCRVLDYLGWNRSTVKSMYTEDR